jgi:hypothetical protein
MKRTLEYVWIILVILTIFAYLLGYLKLISTSLVAILLISTFIKGQLVIDYFMGLKTVQLKYRLIPTGWLGIVISLIAVAYYLPVTATH